MSVRYADGGRERILAQGLRLAGREEDPAALAALEGLAAVAAAWCGREDIGPEMEGTLAVLLSRQLTGLGERPVTQVKRGDTAITYGSDRDGMGSMAQLLAPFVRLRAPKGGGRCG